MIWTNDALATIVIARAIGLHIDPPLACLLLAGLGLASALPSTPGYVGIYQFVAVSVLVPFGVSRTQAIGFILLMQALQYLVVGLWGAFGFWKFRVLRSGYGIARERQEQTVSEEARPIVSLVERV